MKREVNPFDYAGDICKALPKGILLTTKCGEEVNTMTIGWGTIGIDWSRPVFLAAMLFHTPLSSFYFFFRFLFMTSFASFI